MVDQSSVAPLQPIQGLDLRFSEKTQNVKGRKKVLILHSFTSKFRQDFLCNPANPRLKLHLSKEKTDHN